MSKFRIFFITLALFCVIAMTVHSQAAIPHSSLNWALNDGILTISGNGPMPDWQSTTSSDRPWHGQRTRITSVIIEDGVTRIGNNAFFDHSSMISVSIGRGINTIGDAAFARCSALESVIIPDNVTTLGNSVFNNCTRMTSVTIGSGISTIPNSAFQNTGLTSVTIPEGITSIGSHAFRDNARLTTIYYNAVNCGNVTSTNYQFYDCQFLTTVVIGNRVRRIPDRLFYNIPSLENVTISNSVTDIGAYAFANCANLTSIVIPDSVETLGIFVFNNCTRLRSATIGSGITAIPNNAFSNTGLTSVTIPEGITSIGAGAFRDNSRLTTVYFNARNCADVTSTNYHFYNNAALETVVFGDNVRRIPAFALSGISNLETITIGSRVNAIGSYAFANLSNLTEIINKAVTPQTFAANSFVFNNVNRANIRLSVPANALDTYRNAAEWKDFGNIIGN